MIEKIGDIWEYHDKGHWIVIPTNMTLNKYSFSVMGKGLAFEAKQRYASLPYEYGKHIFSINKNKVFPVARYRLFLFPTKDYVFSDSKIKIIENSIFSLVTLVNIYNIDCVYLPKVGCGSGKLFWEDVRPVLSSLLDDRFIIITGKKE